MYFLNDRMVPVASVITGSIFVFKFHIRYISVIRSVYFKIFRLLSCLHFYLLRVQRLLSHMFLFHNNNTLAEKKDES